MPAAAGRSTGRSMRFGRRRKRMPAAAGRSTGRSMRYYRRRRRTTSMRYYRRRRTKTKQAGSEEKRTFEKTKAFIRVEYMKVDVCKTVSVNIAKAIQKAKAASTNATRDAAVAAAAAATAAANTTASGGGTRGHELGDQLYNTLSSEQRYENMHCVVRKVILDTRLCNGDNDCGEENIAADKKQERRRRQQGKGKRKEQGASTASTQNMSSQGKGKRKERVRMGEVQNSESMKFMPHRTVTQAANKKGAAQKTPEQRAKAVEEMTELGKDEQLKRIQEILAAMVV